MFKEHRSWAITIFIMKYFSYIWKTLTAFSLNNLMLEMTRFFSFVTIPILHILKSSLSFFSGPSLEFLSPVQRSMSQINLIFSYLSDYEAGHSFSIILFISCYTQCHGDFFVQSRNVAFKHSVLPWNLFLPQLRPFCIYLKQISSYLEPFFQFIIIT